MMTTASTQVSPSAGAGVLLRAGAVALGVVALLVVGAGLLGGRGAVAGAALGGVATLLVLLLGSLLVNAVAGLVPSLSLLVALLTYLLQLLVLALLLAAVRGTGALDDGTLAGGWVAGAVIVVTACWLVVQVFLAVRRRIPVYDLPEAGPGAGSDEPGARLAGAEPGAR